MALAGRTDGRSALVCEGVHAQVDTDTLQRSFSNNIKGSPKTPLLLCVSFQDTICT